MSVGVSIEFKENEQSTLEQITITLQQIADKYNYYLFIEPNYNGNSAVSSMAIGEWNYAEKKFIQPHTISIDCYDPSYVDDHGRKYQTFYESSDFPLDATGISVDEDGAISFYLSMYFFGLGDNVSTRAKILLNVVHGFLQAFPQGILSSEVDQVFSSEMVEKIAQQPFDPYWYTNEGLPYNQ